MSDSKSAVVFGEIFDECATLCRMGGTVEDEAIRIAKKFWHMSYEYDFSHEDMEADDGLVELGLARVIEDEDGDPAVQYRSPSGLGWEEY